MVLTSMRSLWPICIILKWLENTIKSSTPDPFKLYKLAYPTVLKLKGDVNTTLIDDRVLSNRLSNNYVRYC